MNSQSFQRTGATGNRRRKNPLDTRREAVKGVNIPTSRLTTDDSVSPSPDRHGRNPNRWIPPDPTRPTPEETSAYQQHLLDDPEFPFNLEDYCNIKREYQDDWTARSSTPVLSDPIHQGNIGIAPLSLHVSQVFIEPYMKDGNPQFEGSSPSSPLSPGLNRRATFYGNELTQFAPLDDFRLFTSYAATVTGTPSDSSALSSGRASLYSVSRKGFDQTPPLSESYASIEPSCSSPSIDRQGRVSDDGRTSWSSAFRIPEDSDEDDASSVTSE
jgi:hypothetical protein